MQSISFKKVFLAILIVILLSKWDKVTEFLSGIYDFFCQALEPMRDMPVMGKYIVTMCLLGLLYVTIFKLLYHRKQ